jgi:hypothetical protein
MAKLTQRTGQLPMFMTARDIVATHQPSDWDRDKTYPKGQPSRLETDSEVLSRKLSESKGGDWAGFHESIAAEGVKTPVHLSMQFGRSGKPQIGEGHHRVASTMDINPDRYIPVMHHETLDDLGNWIMDNE